MQEPLDLETDNRFRQEKAQEASASSREVALGEVVRFFVRSLPLIAVAAVVVAVLYLVYSELTYSPVYRTSATLIVTPPSRSAEFRRSPLTVPAYKQLLDSPTVVAQARQQLIDEGVLEPDDRLRAGRELRSKLFFSRNDRRQTEVAPMIELSVAGGDPEGVARITNVWGLVFVEEVRQMMETNTREAIEVVETLYPASERRLLDLEKKKEETYVDYSRRISGTWTSWGEKMAAHDQKTLEMEADHDAATAKKAAEVADENRRLTRTAELEAMTIAYQELQVTAARQQEELARAQAEVAAVSKRLETTPVFLERGEEEGERAPVRLEAGTVLVTPGDELNPVYVELDRRLADAQVRVATLTAQQERTSLRLAEMDAAIQALDSGLRGGEVSLENLLERRQAEWRMLRVQREEERAELERQRDRLIEALRFERDAVIAGINREIELETKRANELNVSFTDAALAKAQLDIPDVRFGSRAVPPPDPEPRQRAFKTAVALLVGGILGFALAILRRSLKAVSGPA